jgi:hypothetical protein
MIKGFLESFPFARGDEGEGNFSAVMLSPPLFQRGLSDNAEFPRGLVRIGGGADRGHHGDTVGAGPDDLRRVGGVETAYCDERPARSNPQYPFVSVFVGVSKTGLTPR